MALGSVAASSSGQCPPEPPPQEPPGAPRPLEAQAMFDTADAFAFDAAAQELLDEEENEARDSGFFSLGIDS